MPRNAAKKLNNDEVCLPIVISVNPNSNTQHNSTHLQQATQLQQRRRRRTKKKGIKRTSAARTDNSSKTANTEAVTTAVTSAAAVKHKSIPVTSAKRRSPELIAALYPIVIETCLETADSTQNPTVASTEITNAIVPDTDAGSVISAGVRVPIGIGGRLRKRRSVIGYVPKRRGIGKSKSKAKSQVKPLLVKAAAGQSISRLATLRARKVPEHGNKSNENKSKKHAAWYCLDEALLNKIEPLEIEVKKSTSKRKRGNSIATRKRNSAPKSQPINSLTENNLFIGCAEIISSPALISVCDLGESDVLHSVAAEAEALTPTAATPSASPNKKRSRGMSLYERRYQTTDDARNTGVVTNGYLSSTRTSSASSSAVHSDADTQDITQQFYMPAAPATGVASSSSSVTQLGNGSTLNHAPSMATLCNIGNTCYLNSVVYTLRFAPRFLHNLHHLIVDLSTIQQSIVRQRAKSSSLGRGISAVQLENARSWSSKDLAALGQSAMTNMDSGNNFAQRSSHQLLTERLHELYQNLHCNEVAESTEPFHADTLLHAIQDVSSIFEGNQQQDAHEFLMCLLNSIRETCQTLIKAIAECPDLILNGYIRNADEVDGAGGYANDLEGLTPNSGTGGNVSSSLTATPLSTSSLNTSNITKASFFSRKSKRKEEAKNSKNSRLQSPLKDAQSGGSLQPTSNSLFYLNSVDLSGAPSTPVSTTANTVIVKNITGNVSGNEGDDLSPVSILKDKERLAEKIRELGLDFFSEDFEGVTVSTTKCLSCETVTEQKESMIDIAVPVPISGYDSSDYTEKPSSFIQNSCVTREFFRGENKYRCEQCTGYTEAIRSISYEVLPRLLVIQLSRFSGGMEKISSYIPTSFTLQCFCAKCCELSDANKLHIYKLYSVITHVGATMSVGHYIAYTCSLDWANEYINCPKDRRNQQHNNTQANGLANNGLQLSASSSAQSTQAASAASAAASALASSGSSLIKKMKFVRSKASSSGDMSKNVKNLNGITSKAITNGLGKLSMNTTCHSLSCCATRICSVQQQQQQLQLQMNSTNDLSEESLQNGSNHNVCLGSANNSSSSTSGYTSYPPGYGSTGRGGTKTTYSAYASSSSGSSANGDPIWYMCDDDKIKAMTQREFEELLSPARKITVTPYLLFYARFDLQTSQASSSNRGVATATPTQAQSWSNESLQSGGSGSNAANLHKM